MPRYRTQPEHRAIMEDKLGRRLKDTEVVHHINGNGLDNRPENLMVMTRKVHSKTHGPDIASAKARKKRDSLKNERFMIRFDDDMAERVRQLSAIESRRVQDQVRWRGSACADDRQSACGGALGPDLGRRDGAGDRKDKPMSFPRPCSSLKKRYEVIEIQGRWYIADLMNPDSVPSEFKTREDAEIEAQIWNLLAGYGAA